MLVEVFERQFVHLHVDRRAQALRRALRDGRHHPALHVRAQRVRHIQRHERPADARDGSHVDGPQHRLAVDHRGQTLGDLVGHVTQIIRADNLADRAHHAQHERDDDRRDIPAAEPHQVLECAAQIIRFFSGRTTTRAVWPHSSWHNAFLPFTKRLFPPCAASRAEFLFAQLRLRDLPVHIA